MRQWSKRIWLATGVVALGITAVAVWVAVREPAPWLDVRFLTYTNPVHYSRGLALFVISNRTDRPVSFDPLPEYQLNGQWQPIFVSYRPNRSRAALLPPHQTYVFRMLYPEDGRAFRAMAGYWHPHTPMELWRARWAERLIRRNLTTPAKWIVPRAEPREIRSEEYHWPGRDP